MMKFEHRREPLLPRQLFFIRVLRHLILAGGLIFGALGLGILGYHYFAGFAWLDALLNASMILSGMGPLTPPKTWGGKLFAGLYALYSGLALLGATTIILAPLVHRLLHHFHMESDRMIRYTQKYGPMDWRHAGAHAVY